MVRMVYKTSPLYTDLPCILFLWLLFFFVLGESFFSVQVIQIFLSLISALLLTRILAIHYPKASPWMFLLMIISPFESIYSVALLSENLTSFLLVISAFFIFTYDRPFKWILAGIALGLACLTRDIYLLMGFFNHFEWDFLQCHFFVNAHKPRLQQLLGL